jgi:hypothetical protein
MIVFFGQIASILVYVPISLDHLCMLKLLSAIGGNRGQAKGHQANFVVLISAC